MKLSPKIAKRLTDARSIQAKATRTKLALGLVFTESWVLRCLKDNKDNGPMTTAKALQIIGEDLGLSQEQILVDEETKDRARKKAAA